MSTVKVSSKKKRSSEAIEASKSNSLKQRVLQIGYDWPRTEAIQRWYSSFTTHIPVRFNLTDH